LSRASVNSSPVCEANGGGAAKRRWGLSRKRRARHWRARLDPTSPHPAFYCLPLVSSAPADDPMGFANQGRGSASRPVPKKCSESRLTGPLGWKSGKISAPVPFQSVTAERCRSGRTGRFAQDPLKRQGCPALGAPAAQIRSKGDDSMRSHRRGVFAKKMGRSRPNPEGTGWLRPVCFVAASLAMGKASRRSPRLASGAQAPGSRGIPDASGGPRRYRGKTLSRVRIAG